MDTGDEVINEQETHLRAMEGRCEREGDLIGVASCLCSSKPSIILLNYQQLLASTVETTPRDSCSNQPANRALRNRS